MLCSVCKKKEATVFLTEIIEDKVLKVDLCEDCAKERGVTDPAGFTQADLLLGLGLAPAKQSKPSTPENEWRCPECGFTQADFKKAGRLGCATCYETFGEELDELLRAMHKGLKHVGKVPKGLQTAVVVTERLKELQQQLKQAIASENYEQAAVLRDEIKRLEAAPGQVKPKDQ